MITGCMCYLDIERVENKSFKIVLSKFIINYFFLALLSDISQNDSSLSLLVKAQMTVKQPI